MNSWLSKFRQMTTMGPWDLGMVAYVNKTATDCFLMYISHIMKRDIMLVENSSKRVRVFK